MSPAERYERARSVRWDDAKHVASSLLERAAIIAEACHVDFDAADRRAWALEGPEKQRGFGW